MKKFLVIGVVGLLFLTGCGSKNADIVCEGEINESGLNAKATYYAYLKDGKVSRVDVDMTLDDADKAKQTCSMFELVKSMGGDETKDLNIKCSGKTISIENYPTDSEEGMTGTKEEFIAAAEKEGLKCK